MQLVADCVTFAYNGCPVIREVSVTIESGQVMGVIGPNGSGKSTLIRLLARAFPPRSGRISLDGRNLNSYGRAELARLVAVVAQSPQLPDAFTVEELVLLGRTPHLGFLADEGPRDLQVARQAMEITDTLQFAHRRLAQLSGGERQRVVIARALAQEPDVLLLDEPTAYLDLRHQMETLELVRDLAHRDGLTVVITLHDLNEAALYADRLALLAEGRLLGVGTPASVLIPSLLTEAYRVPVTVARHPVYNTPMVIPMMSRA